MLSRILLDNIFVQQVESKVELRCIYILALFIQRCCVLSDKQNFCMIHQNQGMGPGEAEEGKNRKGCSCNFCSSISAGISEVYFISEGKTEMLGSFEWHYYIWLNSHVFSFHLLFVYLLVHWMSAAQAYKMWEIRKFILCMPVHYKIPWFHVVFYMFSDLIISHCRVSPLSYLPFTIRRSPSAVHRPPSNQDIYRKPP